MAGFRPAIARNGVVLLLLFFPTESSVERPMW
jgi:hypothetical protein